MKHDKMTATHYKERLEFYKSQLKSYIIAEIRFDVTEDRPKVLENGTDDAVIEYVVDDYNSVNIDDFLNHYINARSFIEALGDDKKVFADELREELTNEYNNQIEQDMKELAEYIGSNKSTIEEKVTAGFLSDDPKSLIIYLNNAYNVWLSKQYGDGSVMRLITNPDKLDLFISQNQILVDIIVKTVSDNVDKIDKCKECLDNGLHTFEVLPT